MGPTKEALLKAELANQTYGLAMAQVRFGGPTGIWLECLAKGCTESKAIVGSSSEGWESVTDAEVAEIFRRHGWTGNGDRMLAARCPEHSKLDPSVVTGNN